MSPALRQTPNVSRPNLDAALRDFSVGLGLADAKRAVTDNVIVTPTLLAIGPKRRPIMNGDLSDSHKLQGLLKAAASFSWCRWSRDVSEDIAWELLAVRHVCTGTRTGPRSYLAVLCGKTLAANFQTTTRTETVNASHC
jgi:hypothetical protein